jgi:hypothetical protein
MNATDYLILLNFDARYRVRFEVDKGKILQFVVQLELLSSDKWVTVVRYDTAHRSAHRDSYKADGSVSRHEALPVSEYKDALTYAIRDIRLNWEEWIRQYQER